MPCRNFGIAALAPLRKAWRRGAAMQQCDARKNPPRRSHLLKSLDSQVTQLSWWAFFITT